MTPSGARGVVNDAIAIYLADATIASAFVARWCAGHRAVAVDGLFRVREDEPTQRMGASHQRRRSDAGSGASGCDRQAGKPGGADYPGFVAWAPV
jgi:hypothetical protein